jgi:hypothetical protein
MNPWASTYLLLTRLPEQSLRGALDATPISRRPSYTEDHDVYSLTRQLLQTRNSVLLLFSNAGQL